MPLGAPISPRTVLQAIELANALPRPATVSCFLRVLERPVRLNATISIFSAQPAQGRRSPRIFLYYEPLIISVVPEGPGQHLVEFGEIRDEGRTLKAEIAFPLENELLPQEPFRRLMFDERFTSCAFCHANEAPAEQMSFDGAFVSQALRPLPSDRVSVQSLIDEHQVCDSSVEPERCAILDAIVTPGEIVDWDFPETFDTFQ